MDQVVRSTLATVCIIAIASTCTFCQMLPVNYNPRSIAGAGAGICPETQDLRESMKQDIHSLINNSVLPVLNPEHEACGCGGHGWRRAAYLNVTDPMQTCPQT